MRSSICRWVVAWCAAFALAGWSAAAPPSSEVAKVTGGGQAMFDDPRFGGLTTTFAMGVSVQDDGSAKGNFTCLINGVLSLHVMAETGELNADGSVTFSGPGIVHFAGGGTVVDYFTVTASAGGPGVGMFCLAPPTFPDTDCDHETVIDGGITVHTR